MEITITYTGKGCQTCGLGMDESFEPYGLEEPCFNDGNYGHETEYCKHDTIHLCKMSHKCGAKECNCYSLSFEEKKEILKNQRKIRIVDLARNLPH